MGWSVTLRGAAFALAGVAVAGCSSAGRESTTSAADSTPSCGSGEYGTVCQIGAGAGLPQSTAYYETGIPGRNKLNMLWVGVQSPPDLCAQQYGGYAWANGVDGGIYQTDSTFGVDHSYAYADDRGVRHGSATTPVASPSCSSQQGSGCYYFPCDPATQNAVSNYHLRAFGPFEDAALGEIWLGTLNTEYWYWNRAPACTAEEEGDNQVDIDYKDAESHTLQTDDGKADYESNGALWCLGAGVAYRGDVTMGDGTVLHVYGAAGGG